MSSCPAQVTADVGRRAVWGYAQRVRIGAILLVSLVVVGCGDERQAGRDPAPTASSPESAEAENTRAATPSSGQTAEAESDPTATRTRGGRAEAQLRKLFDSYHDAWDARDWDALCQTVAPEVTDDVRVTLKKIGGDPNPPRACPDAHEQLHSLVGEELADELDGEMAQTRALDTVDIKGKTAFLNYHYVDEGTRKALTQHARKIDGEWKLID